MYSFIEWLIGGITQSIVDVLSFKTGFILPKILLFISIGLILLFAFGGALAITGY